MNTRSGLPLTLDHLGHDFVMTWRTALREPGVTLAILLTLGLGLGAAAAILSFLAAALLRPLPYERADRLVHVWEQRVGTTERAAISYPTLLDWRERSTTLARVEAYDAGNLVVG